MAKKGKMDIQDLVLEAKNFKTLEDVKNAVYSNLNSSYGQDKLRRAVEKAEYNYKRGKDKDFVTFLSLLSTILDGNDD